MLVDQRDFFDEVLDALTNDLAADRAGQVAPAQVDQFLGLLRAEGRPRVFG